MAKYCLLIIASINIPPPKDSTPVPQSVSSNWCLRQLFNNSFLPSIRPAAPELYLYMIRGSQDHIPMIVFPSKKKKKGKKRKQVILNRKHRHEKPVLVNQAFREPSDGVPGRCIAGKEGKPISKLCINSCKQLLPLPKQRAPYNQTVPRCLAGVLPVVSASVSAACRLGTEWWQ